MKCSRLFKKSHKHAEPTGHNLSGYVVSSYSTNVRSAALGGRGTSCPASCSML